jgi:predicted nucleic acid-binding protein
VERELDRDPVMNWISLGEVFYVVWRAAGAERATEVVRDLRARVELDMASPERVLEAAAIKAVHPMAYADAFAVATSVALEAVLWTGDPEILGAHGGWKVKDLRRGVSP